MDLITTLILPGLGNSGPAHWQSHWERHDPTCHRVAQEEWEAPHCADWARALDAAVGAAESPVVLVAHSSSCALVAHWARDAAPFNLSRVRGALLVAPSDPDGPNYPTGPIGFGPVPLDRLPFPSTVVASTDDRYIGFARAQAYAAAWGSKFVNVGAKGHINADSAIGAWPVGYALLTELRTPSRAPQQNVIV
jgi:predicted alpha/beta hydrolase family esterase